MPVPNSFANVTTSIPLSQLDANFNTPITLGNTAIQLGNTVTTLNNMTLANVTVTSGNVTITNVTVTTANVTTANIATLSVTGNANVDGNVTLGNASTDTVTVNGYMGVGGAASSARSLYVQSTALAGTIQIGVDSRPVFTSGATGAGYGIISSPATAAASFTQGSLFGIGVLDATKGAGSTITSQFGIRIFDQTQGNANYGLWMDVTAAANKWNIYASGTADNYFAGNVGIGVTPSAWATYKAMQMGTTTPFALDSSGAIGLNYYYDGAYKYVGTGLATLYSVAAGQHRWFNAASGTAGNAITFTQAMTLDASGRLLVNTTTVRSGYSYNLVLEGAGVNGGIGIVNNAATTVGTALKLGKSRGTTAGSVTAVTANDSLGAITFDGADGTSMVTGASINAEVDGTVSTGVMPTRLTFATENTSGTFDERMRITSAGEVLVGGTTSVNAKQGSVTVESTTAGTVNLVRNDTTVTTGEALGELAFFGNDTTSNTRTNLANIQALASSDHAAGDNPTDLVFGTTPDGSATRAEAMRITQAKNLKIGGTASRATTEGTNQLVLFNGTAPVGTLANGVSFYSAAGEARVMDAAGNSTLLSPHDQATNEWIFHSKHTPTGKVLRIDVEKMLRFINDHFGLDMVHEFTEE